MNFEGKTTVVTGAANGIGAALARRFHTAGARVVLADRDAANLKIVENELNAIRPDSAFAVVADIGTEAGNIALIDAARAKFGFIDLFISCRIVVTNWKWAIQRHQTWCSGLC